MAGVPWKKKPYQLWPGSLARGTIWLLLFFACWKFLNTTYFIPLHWRTTKPLADLVFKLNMTKHSLCHHFEENWGYHSLVMGRKQWGRQRILSKEFLVYRILAMWFFLYNEDPPWVFLWSLHSWFAYLVIQWLRKNVMNDSCITFLHEISSGMRLVSGPFKCNVLKGLFSFYLCVIYIFLTWTCTVGRPSRRKQPTCRRRQATVRNNLDIPGHWWIRRSASFRRRQ